MKQIDPIKAEEWSQREKAGQEILSEIRTVMHEAKNRGMWLAVLVNCLLGQVIKANIWVAQKMRRLYVL